MHNISSNNFIILGSNIFISDNRVLTLFCFLKAISVLSHHKPDFQSSIYAFECLKDVLTNCTKIVTDKRQYKLSEPITFHYDTAKMAIFSHMKRWVVSMGLKQNKFMRKQRLQHRKALFIHFMEFCGQWIRHIK